MSGRTKFIIAWTVLLVGTVIVWAVAFSFLEGYALSHDDAITLSRFVWEADQKWPLFIPVFCYLNGAMTWAFIVHIKWHWLPEDKSDHRG